MVKYCEKFQHEYDEASTTISGYNHNTLEQQAVEGLDFILSHLKEPMFPRTISTHTTEGIQIIVFNRDMILARFKQANFLDCRINAYPYSAGRKFSNSQRIDLVMIDLDLSNFKSRLVLDKALAKTLRNIKGTFGTGFESSVLWSGNGYHIYIPIESRYTLEERQEFNRFKEPSKQFLRFAEWYFSNGKCDPAHNNSVSFANCMLRIPGSHNSKCVQRNDRKSDDSTQVRIIKEWNSRRAPFYLLIGSFLAYLTDKNMMETKRHKQYLDHKYGENRSNTTIPWIETLLQTPLADHRKYCIWRILVPYLTNVRQLSYEESFNMIKSWLDKCNHLNRLNFDSKIKIDEALKRVKKYLPISLKNMQTERRELYNRIVSNWQKE